MGLELQHISVADYFHDHGMFYDLGGHLSRCERPELAMMDSAYQYGQHSKDGTAAYVARMPSAPILKLASILKPYPTLWAGFKDGFTNGLDARFIENAPKPFDPKDLAALAMGVASQPELNEIFQDRLAAHGMAIIIKPLASELFEPHRHAVVMALGPKAEPIIYATKMGELVPVPQGSEYLEDLRAYALAQAQKPRPSPL
jgi:hypothetical protein